MSRSGEVMPRARSCTSARPRTAASAARTGRLRPALVADRQHHARCPQTVATITTPSLTLIEGRRSSGLMARARSRCRGRCGRGRRRACAAGRGCASRPCAGPEPSRQPQTSASSCSRVSTAPGRAASTRRRSNSVGVRCTSSPSTVTLARRGVELERAEPDGLAGGRGPPLDAPQQRPDAGDQLARRERLGHVVVGADAEPDQHVRLLRRAR